MVGPIGLVLTMRGGVSLGTYVAGALTEVFWALQNVTSDPPPAGAEHRNVQIDVITGASAGAMSAALFARALTGAPDSIESLRIEHDKVADAPGDRGNSPTCAREYGLQIAGADGPSAFCGHVRDDFRSVRSMQPLIWRTNTSARLLHPLTALQRDSFSPRASG